MSDLVPSAARPVSRSNELVRIEEFEHAGLRVELSVVGHDLSPRYCDCAPEGVVVCAEPYGGLTDVGGDGRRVLADDAALALLLAAPLTEPGLEVLEAHLRARYGATVVLPLFVDEADASARTGVSLSVESGDGVLAGVIFDWPDSGGASEGVSSGSAESRVREELRRAVDYYRDYLRGQILLASVCDLDGDNGWWADMNYDGDLEDLREAARQAAEDNAPEAAAALKQRRQWIEES